MNRDPDILAREEAAVRQGILEDRLAGFVPSGDFFRRPTGGGNCAPPRYDYENEEVGGVSADVASEADAFRRQLVNEGWLEA